MTITSLPLRPGVFVAGDAATSASLYCMDHIQGGGAAKAIDRYLREKIIHR